jgi:hypothetical protein
MNFRNNSENSSFSTSRYCYASTSRYCYGSISVIVKEVQAQKKLCFHEQEPLHSLLSSGWFQEGFAVFQKLIA